MGEPTLDRYPDSPLKLAMLQRGVSIRGLAKRLEPDGDEKTLSDRRGQIRGWLDGGQPQPDNAVKLAAALELPEAYFVRERVPRSDVRAEIGELRRRLDAIEAVLRERLGALPHHREASGSR